MGMTKEKLIEVLTKYFGLNDQDGTYTYSLTRVKSAFNVGTITIDDFQEFDDEQIEDVAQYIIQEFSK